MSSSAPAAGVRIIFAFAPPCKGAIAIQYRIFTQRKCRYPIGSIAAAYRAAIARGYRSESDTAFHRRRDFDEIDAIADDPRGHGPTEETSHVQASRCVARVLASCRARRLASIHRTTRVRRRMSG